MADNYLEKRYAEVFGGGGRRTLSQRPSLDRLLGKPLAALSSADPAYRVHPAQLERIAGAADLLLDEWGWSRSCEAESGCIRLCPPEDRGENDALFLAGQAQMAMRLKAVEMGLALHTVSPFCARVFKPSQAASKGPVKESR